jgi:hypothetical protein
MSDQELADHASSSCCTESVESSWHSGTDSTQIGLLDRNSDPYIPLSTIQTCLTEEATDAAAAAPPRPGSISPQYPATQRRRRAVAHVDGTQQGEDHRALHYKMAQSEAQPRRWSFKHARRTPQAGPVSSSRVSPERSRSSSPFVEARSRGITTRKRSNNLCK